MQMMQGSNRDSYRLIRKIWERRTPGGICFENGISFLSFDLERSDHLLSPDVFLMRALKDFNQSQ